MNPVDDTLILQIAQRGQVTLPKTLRERYNLKPGDPLTLLDIGGVFVLSPRRSQVDALADDIVQALAEGGESLESMLTAVREARLRYNTQDQ